MGRELHVMDSAGTGHERVTYAVMSMTGHRDMSRTHQVRGTNVSRTKLCTNVRD